ncbi:MAG: bifunctional 5,10-methylenetetrahydrofolate dehydrogenase/5,10-methenyltetrahydrofolate cyclohydrolase [Candidatus Omnitrophica bacterium]|nr:bifunctional 5,10-methylenetetrahydrofolate dehydrogenase/5,10-methenyltetrahydrofolate cyclohydrolase [Candidatus Omnitrophota bacterium]
MDSRILDGKKMSDEIKRTIKRDIESLSLHEKMKLAVIEIGKDTSSGVYLSAQKKLADELGIEYYVRELSSSISQKEAENEILKLNGDNSVTGIIIETPVPKSLKIERLFEKIAPHKDAEGLNPSNIGKLAYENWTVAPCTASACMVLIDSTGVKLRGKEAVIIGHSAIVGKPLSLMLLSRLATTTVCHIGTYEAGLLEEHVNKADILIVAVGKKYLIKGNWIKKGAIVIDVGINKNGDKISGDVDFDGAKKVAAYITPVPGGVGPVTTVMLMKNVVELYKNKIRKA